ncbi:hypothetical protein [Nodularia sp. UHCC 0506]|uniref:hypothetical protein n=1 Tax=Nodularia sp. UHCC 0506 TaxID=3110243 RepID=UPI002B1FB165|nr:hypothetical protein [Nodularia sp. UHCC 0506]MEA5516326.1 hypothetical protein [Nodularia sp. UHCC 0506]
MKSVLALIDEKKQKFRHTPFIKFLQDRSIDPRQRLAFAPCFAPFVMGFGELNKSVWRDETSNDPIQAIINQHTYEDDGHWLWFLEDMQKLGFNISLNFNDALSFLWSDETQVSRQTIYKIYQHTHQARPIHKLVVIETIEAIADIFLSTTEQVTQELKILTRQEYRYFGIHHFLIDSGHTMNSSATEECISKILLTADNEQTSLELVEKVFDIFNLLTSALLNYAKNHPIEQSQNHKITQKLIFR